MTSKLQLDLEDLQKQLTDLYITVSVAYKRMSKVKDLYSRQIIQSGIDNDIKRANELSDKTEALKKEILKQWNETMANKVRD
jgi:hypothetical protein